jgi:hypothetical protein
MQPNFSVEIAYDCHLLSIRHYTEDLKKSYLESKEIVAFGDLNGTFQMIYKDSLH